MYGFILGYERFQFGPLDPGSGTPWLWKYPAAHLLDYSVGTMRAGWGEQGEPQTGNRGSSIKMSALAQGIEIRAQALI